MDEKIESIKMAQCAKWDAESKIEMAIRELQEKTNLSVEAVDIELMKVENYGPKAALQTVKSVEIKLMI